MVDIFRPTPVKILFEGSHPEIYSPSADGHHVQIIVECVVFLVVAGGYVGNAIHWGWAHN